MMAVGTIQRETGSKRQPGVRQYLIALICVILWGLVECGVRELPPNLPNVWGGRSVSKKWRHSGQIFAFSGMDGQTIAGTSFVGLFQEHKYSIWFSADVPRVLKMDLQVQDTAVDVSVGDVFIVNDAAGDRVLAVTFANGRVIQGYGRAKVSLESKTTKRIKKPNVWSSVSQPTGILAVLRGVKRKEKDYLVLMTKPDASNPSLLLFTLVYSDNQAEAVKLAETFNAGQSVSGVDATIAKRLSTYWDIPEIGDSARNRFLKKCYSVMRVNTRSSLGFVNQHWSTPDRVPHRHMWLWDSAFHSLGMNWMNPDLSWEFLKSILDSQLVTKDGFVPIEVVPNEPCEVKKETQPPVLAMAVYENYLFHGSKARLKLVVGALERYVEWDVANMDKNENGLFEWRNKFESGLDNSPLFDNGAELDSVDLSTFLCMEMRYISLIHRELGQQDKADVWELGAEQLADRIRTVFWDSEDGFFYYKYLDGRRFRKVKASTGFLPMLLGGLETGQAKQLLSHLMSSTEFHTEVPVPSVSVSNPQYGGNMWRGPMWVNMNFLVVEGLKALARQFDDPVGELGMDPVQLANDIAEKTVQTVQKYYEEFGVVFEYYDSADEVVPTKLPRKHLHGSGGVRDYHWSSALSLHMIMGNSTWNLAATDHFVHPPEVRNGNTQN